MALVILGGISVKAGPFEDPNQGPVPFRKHLVPLEPNQMADVVRCLVDVADAVGADSAEERRAISQIFALCEALEPENRKFARLRNDLSARDFRGEGSFDNVRGRIRSLWGVISWLETQKAGIDGQALAACLKDVMVVMNPEHPRADELRKTGEIGDWDSWVMPVSAFRANDRVPEPDDSQGWPESDDLPTKIPEEPVSIRLQEASLPAILWMPDQEGGKKYPVAKVEQLRMKAHIRGAPDPEEVDTEYRPFHVSIGAWGDSPHTDRLSRLVERIIRNRFPSLPEGLHIEIRHPDLETSLGTKQSHALSAVCTVLVNSALTGQEQSGLILGVLDGGGGFHTSRDAWPKLDALRDSEGLRIIVPAEAESYVSAYLAMERPEFLLKNEVYTASNLDEVLELSVSPLSPELQELGERFAEIKEKQSGQETSFYLTNSFVRQRLVALVKDEPRHLSAKLLTMQSIGQRPVSISKEVLASELRQSMIPMIAVFQREYIAPRGDGVGELYEQCRLGVEQAAQYASRDDQEVVDRANDVLAHFRALDRAIRSKRGEDWEAERDVNVAKKELARSHHEFRDYVTKILRAGEEE